MARIYAIILCFGAVVIGLDQWTKHLILQQFSQVGQSEEIFSWFSFTLVHNRGAAFGMLRDLPDSIRQGFFLVLPLAVLGLFWWSMVRHFKPHETIGPVAMGLVFGGAIGNFIDRLAHGHVIDFLDWHYPSATGSCLPLFYPIPGTGGCHWPVFNIADAAITGAAVLLLAEWALVALKERRRAAA
jgi:signal peptidase II